MRCKTLRVCLVALLLNFVFYIEVQAAKSVDVTITANPSGFFAPTSFDVIRVTDHKIRATWVANPLAVTTYIRAKVGSYPTSETDGYLVYDGAGVTVDDNSVSLDETAANVYYRAWSKDGVGTFSPDFAQDFAGGIGMVLLALLSGAVLMTIAAFIVAYITKIGLLKWIAAGLWVVTGAYAYTQKTTTWDVFYSLFFMCFFVAVAIAVEYGYGEYKASKNNKVNVNVDLEQFRNEYAAQREAFDSMRLSSATPVNRRSPRYSTDDEERILKKSQTLYEQKLHEKYGPGKQVQKKR